MSPPPPRASGLSGVLGPRWVCERAWSRDSAAPVGFGTAGSGSAAPEPGEEAAAATAAAAALFLGLDPSLCSADARGAAAPDPAGRRERGRRRAARDWRRRGLAGPRERPEVAARLGHHPRAASLLSAHAPHPLVNLFPLQSRQDPKACCADGPSP